jgi:uncharacterized SAM-binding protein YcdF (DUF218 family)
METPESTEEKEKEVYPYDAVIILGGGLQKTGGKFYPTDYRHEDEFGMLGAGMRMVTATEMYIESQTRNFVFATGVTDKNRAKFGDNVPTEAEIYEEKFLRVIEGLKKRPDYKTKLENLPPPNVIKEDKSFNTASNIEEISKIIKKQGWQNVRIVSSKYHIPRIKALYEHAQNNDLELKNVKIEFISAEDFVINKKPGRYDKTIKQYYQTDAAKRRLESEARGLHDLQHGTYGEEK